MIQKREVGLAIIFTIISCGLYGIYWLIMLANEANYLSGEQNETSGGMVFLFGMITCGIYLYYWNYKMGKTIMRAQQNANVYPTDNSVLYLILSIFGLQIISYAIMQSEINKIVDYAN